MNGTKYLSCWHVSSCRWFCAERSFDDLVDWGSAFAAQTRPRFHALDIFGASRKVSSTWLSEGFLATSFDIKLTSLRDICTKAGCEELLRLGLRFLAVVGVQGIVE